MKITKNSEEKFYLGKGRKNVHRNRSEIRRS